MASGLAATALSYVGLTAAAAPVALVGAVALFQLSINALLAPLAAIMTDERTRCAERRAGGLLTLAGPAASALTATLAGIPMLRETTRLAIIPAVVAVRVLPLLATRARPVPFPVRT